MIRQLLPWLALMIAACAAQPAGQQDTQKWLHELDASHPRTEPDLKQAAKINAELGFEYLRKGELKLAEEKLKRAADQDSKLTAAYTGLGIVYSRRGRDDESRAAFKEALSLSPDDPDTLNNYGTFLCGKGDAEEAQKLFLKAAKDIDNRKPELAWTNAAACARAKEPDKTEEYLREALKANPEFADALALFATMTYEKGDYLRTRAFLQRYEAVAAPTPNTLWLRAKTETALGDKTSARLYEELLKTKFPEARFADPLGKPAQK